MSRCSPTKTLTRGLFSIGWVKVVGMPRKRATRLRSLAMVRKVRRSRGGGQERGLLVPLPELAVEILPEFLVAGEDQAVAVGLEDVPAERAHLLAERPEGQGAHVARRPAVDALGEGRAIDLAQLLPHMAAGVAEHARAVAEVAEDGEQVGHLGVLRPGRRRERRAVDGGDRLRLAPLVEAEARVVEAEVRLAEEDRRRLALEELRGLPRHLEELHAVGQDHVRLQRLLQARGGLAEDHSRHPRLDAEDIAQQMRDGSDQPRRDRQGREDEGLPACGGMGHRAQHAEVELGEGAHAMEPPVQHLPQRPLPGLRLGLRIVRQRGLSCGGEFLRELHEGLAVQRLPRLRLEPLPTLLCFHSVLFATGAPVAGAGLSRQVAPLPYRCGAATTRRSGAGGVMPHWKGQSGRLRWYHSATNLALPVAGWPDSLQEDAAPGGSGPNGPKEADSP